MAYSAAFVSLHTSTSCSHTHPSVNLVTLPWAIHPAEYILNLQDIALNSCIASPYCPRTTLASFPGPTPLSIACSMARGESLGTRQACISCISCILLCRNIPRNRRCNGDRLPVGLSFGQTTENDLMWIQHVIHDVTMQVHTDYTTPDK